MKIVKGYYAFIFAVGAFILNSCTTTAHIERDESANLSNYKTFAWIDKENKDKLKNEIAEQNLKNSVTAELQKNGYTEVKTNPDLLLTYDLLIEKGVREQSEAVYSRPNSRIYYNPYTRRYASIYYPSQFLGYDNYTTPVKEGTVSISMMDAKTDRTIWQGWTKEELDGNYFSSKEVQKNVKSIFKNFEVAAK